MLGLSLCVLRPARAMKRFNHIFTSQMAFESYGGVRNLISNKQGGLEGDLLA